MLILAIDTTGNVCSAALSDDSKIISESYLNHQKTHSEGLMPMVDFVMQSAGAQLADVSLFASVTGPGSFTGIRIGVSAVKAFAHAADKPCAAISTLDSLCANIPYFDGVICPMLDARRQEVYSAQYDGTKKHQRVGEYRALSVKDLLLELMGKKTMFLGDGALPNWQEIIKAMDGNAFFAGENNLLQRASSACMLACEAYKAGRITTAYELEPFYLRKPQAERNHG